MTEWLLLPSSIKQEKMSVKIVFAFSDLMLQTIEIDEKLTGMISLSFKT